MIDQILKLREILDPERVPEAVVAQAIEENPWFSVQDIHRSLSGIRLWLDRDILEDFAGRYQIPEGNQVRVGVIAAGNLPLVCMHDVLCVLLSGQELYLKPSRQDRVLIGWILNEWSRISPEIARIFHLAERLPEVNLLIGTGSNNTARYLEQSYRTIPRLLRKNRFSVAILDHHTTTADLDALMEDIFSYNGLGCRNVSTVCFLPGFSKTLWEESLRRFPSDQLHPLYLERYLIVSARRRMMRESVQDTGHLLRVPVTELQYASMGEIHELDLGSLKEWAGLYRQNEFRIQCVVGTDVPFGRAQYPAIDDFADGVDTVSWVLDSRNRLVNGLETDKN